MNEKDLVDQSEQSAESERVTFIDNVGMLSADLDRSLAAFEELGFQFSNLARHTLKEPSGEYTKWGTGNHCAMFENGSFLELIGHVEPDKPAGTYQQQIDRYGAHWGKTKVQVRSAIAEADRVFADLGGSAVWTRTFYRHSPDPDFKVGVSPAANSSLMSYPSALQDETMLVGMTMLTDNFSDLPGSSEQPNGCVALDFVLYISDEPLATSERYASDLALPHEKMSYGGRIKIGPVTEIRFASRSILPVSTQSAIHERTVALVACGFRVSDLAQTKDFLVKAGQRIEDHEFGVLVYPKSPDAGLVFFTD